LEDLQGENHPSISTRIFHDPNNPKGEYVYATWDDIEFDKDQVLIKPNNFERIFPSIRLKGSLPILNKIKLEYFERLYPKSILKFYFIDGVCNPLKSNGYSTICTLIDAATEFIEFRYYKSRSKNRIGSFYRHSPTQVRDLFAESLRRNPYFKFLAQTHYASYKIIPIEEISKRIMGRKLHISVKNR
jgi:hypothetical protein